MKTKVPVMKTIGFPDDILVYLLHDCSGYKKQ